MGEKRGRVEVTGETLCGVATFAGLSATQRQDVAIHCRGWRFAAGQHILSHMEARRDVFFVITGRVRATLFSRAGKEVSFQELGAGQMFGELSAIDQGPRSTHVVSLSESLIVSMSPSAFGQVLHEYPSVADATLRRLTGLVRALCERVFEFSALSVTARIHAELLRRARAHMTGDNTAVLSPAPTHADIASRIGTHREAVTRELGELADKNLLERRPGEMVICDVANLKALVDDSLAGE